MEEFLWVEKYRPHTIEDTILPDRLKETFQQFVNQKNLPNLLLTGGPGCGKTTVAKAMLEEIGCQYMVINGSLEGNIDTLRTQIRDFASSKSLDGGRKFVIIDEADYLTAATQPALRNFMEEFSANCGFILTCNFRNRIIDPLISRLSVIEFIFSKQEKMTMAKEIFVRVKQILAKENVENDPKVVAELIKSYFPDFRKVINELQRYSAMGKIDSGILHSISDSQIKTLIGYLKTKGQNFSDARKWIIEMEVDDQVLFRKLYDVAFDEMETQSIPQLVLILQKYMRDAAFVADREINLLACLTEIMIDCNWKD